VRICAAHGLDGRSPFDAVESLGSIDHLVPIEQGLLFFDTMVAMLDACDGLIANMTPFRGPSTDVGTAWEMGYAAGRGLPVFAYTNRLEHYAERVEHDGLVVEAFDLADNLMLEGSVRRSGGAVERYDSGRHGAGAIEMLTGFEACVRQAAAHLLA
jgi:nucleoside 2-deoxyribosyltransferase